jgi:hypothetical protein
MPVELKSGSWVLFTQRGRYKGLKARALHRAGTEEQSYALFKRLTFLTFVGAITYPKSYKTEGFSFSYLKHPICALCFMEACSQAVKAYTVLKIKEPMIFISGIGYRFLLRLIYVTPSCAIFYLFYFC